MECLRREFIELTLHNFVTPYSRQKVIQINHISINYNLLAIALLTFLTYDQGSSILFTLKKAFAIEINRKTTIIIYHQSEFQIREKYFFAVGSVNKQDLCVGFANT
ncbi:hypothetical protein PVAND_006199 [Polypedilum vanderplanki]|uniref:Uncharacterized protein n=1 Tax=Polypedilum vanderplanki TaxID=319348 RepID=A0A9J6C387_POLVA|nr:hypothetical protein PVAND_006199 [Polypedilum vanderplanki]